MESTKDQTVRNWDTYPLWRQRRPWPAEISWGTGAPFPCLECWLPVWPPPLCSHPHLLEEPENIPYSKWLNGLPAEKEDYKIQLVDLFPRKIFFAMSFNFEAIIPKYQITIVIFIARNQIRIYIDRCGSLLTRLTWTVL